MDSLLKKRVAIVGGGPSGIVSVKSALECGLEPVLFEREDDLLGIWNENSGKAWDSLITNISVNTFVYSDYPYDQNIHQQSTPYPKKKQVQDYLNSYIDHFNLKPYCKTSCDVTNIYQLNNTNQWNVEYTRKEQLDDGSCKKEVVVDTFDCVIIATGMFHKPSSIHNIPDIDKFKGDIFYAQNYKNSKRFNGKRVLVFGDSYSGCEIAAELGNDPAVPKVLQCVHKNNWILPRMFKMPDGSILPMDVALFSRDGNDKLKGLDGNQISQEMNKFMKMVNPNQQEIPELKVDEDKGFYMTTSDIYINTFLQNKIVRIKESVVKIDEKNVYFSNGNVEEVDEIVIACGYDMEIPFFSEEIKEKLEFRQHPTVPVILYKTVFHPALDNVAFVGWYKSAFMMIIELQSRWACQIFSGILPPIDKQVMIDGLQVERDIRGTTKQFAHGEVVELGDDLAKQMKILPDFEKIKKDDEKLFKMLWNNFMTPASYRLIGHGSNRDLALKCLERVNNQYYSNHTN